MRHLLSIVWLPISLGVEVSVPLQSNILSWFIMNSIGARFCHRIGWVNNNTIIDLEAIAFFFLKYAAIFAFFILEMFCRAYQEL